MWRLAGSSPVVLSTKDLPHGAEGFTATPPPNRVFDDLAADCAKSVEARVCIHQSEVSVGKHNIVQMGQDRA